MLKLLKLIKLLHIARSVGLRLKRSKMTFKEARKECRRVGTAHATGDALRSMYAELIAMKWYAIGNPEKFYLWLQQSTTDDKSIYETSRELLHDHGKALGVVLA